MPRRFPVGHIVVLYLILAAAGCGSTTSTTTAAPDGQPPSTTAATATPSPGGRAETTAATAHRAIPADAPRVKILTWNVNYGGPGVDAAIKIILDADADLVCLQETTTEWETALRKNLSDRYPHQSFRDSGAGGLGFLSKSPLKSLAWIEPPRIEKNATSAAGGWFPGWIVTTHTPAGALQCLNIHLRPPFDDQGQCTLASLAESGAIHRRELESFVAKLDPDLPAFVTGDFNENDASPGIQFLESKRFADALPQFDSLAITWHWKTTTLNLTGRYDHILHPPAFTCLSARVIKKGRSDHFPVLAEFAATPQP